MTPHEAAGLFKAAVAAVLAQWTLLTLAVDQGWGGRDSHRKRQQLYEDLVAEFEQNKKVDADVLADILAERLQTDFCAVVEDNSDLEVAQLLVNLHEQTSRGCSELAQMVQQQQQQRAAAAAQSRCLNEATAGQGEGSPSEASEAEETLESMLRSSGIGSQPIDGVAGRTRSRQAAAAAAAAAAEAAAEQQADEADGWTQASGRNRRAR